VNHAITGEFKYSELVGQHRSRASWTE